MQESAEAGWQQLVAAAAAGDVENLATLAGAKFVAKTAGTPASQMLFRIFVNKAGGNDASPSRLAALHGMGNILGRGVPADDADGAFSHATLTLLSAALARHRSSLDLQRHDAVVQEQAARALAKWASSGGAGIIWADGAARSALVAAITSPGCHDSIRFQALRALCAIGEADPTARGSVWTEAGGALVALGGACESKETVRVEALKTLASLASDAQRALMWQDTALITSLLAMRQGMRQGMRYAPDAIIVASLSVMERLATDLENNGASMWTYCGRNHVAFFARSAEGVVRLAALRVLVQMCRTPANRCPMWCEAIQKILSEALWSRCAQEVDCAAELAAELSEEEDLRWAMWTHDMGCAAALGVRLVDLASVGPHDVGQSEGGAAEAAAEVEAVAARAGAAGPADRTAHAHTPAHAHAVRAIANFTMADAPRRSMDNFAMKHTAAHKLIRTLFATTASPPAVATHAVRGLAALVADSFFTDLHAQALAYAQHVLRGSADLASDVSDARDARLALREGTLRLLAHLDAQPHLEAVWEAAELRAVVLGSAAVGQPHNGRVAALRVLAKLAGQPRFVEAVWEGACGLLVDAVAEHEPLRVRMQAGLGLVHHAQQRVLWREHVVSHAGGALQDLLMVLRTTEVAHLNGLGLSLHELESFFFHATALLTSRDEPEDAGDGEVVGERRVRARHDVAPLLILRQMWFRQQGEEGSALTKTLNLRQMDLFGSFTAEAKRLEAARELLCAQVKVVFAVDGVRSMGSDEGGLRRQAFVDFGATLATISATDTPADQLSAPTPSLGRRPSLFALTPAGDLVPSSAEALSGEVGWTDTEGNVHVPRLGQAILDRYYYTGAIFGLALVNRCSLGVTFAAHVVQQLRDERVTDEQLLLYHQQTEVTEQAKAFLPELLEKPLEQHGLVGETALPFQAMETDTPLVAVADAVVTDENKALYVRQLLHHKLVASIEEQVHALRAGLRAATQPSAEATGGVALAILSTPDLSLQWRGITVDDSAIESWRARTVVRGDDQLLLRQAEWLWAWLRVASVTVREQVLHFATGSSRLPPDEGMWHFSLCREHQAVCVKETCAPLRIEVTLGCSGARTIPFEVCRTSPYERQMKVRVKATCRAPLPTLEAGDILVEVDGKPLDKSGVVEVKPSTRWQEGSVSFVTQKLDMKHTFVFERRLPPNVMLARAATCANQLSLPRWLTAKELERGMLRTLELGSGSFGLV